MRKKEVRIWLLPGWALKILSSGAKYRLWGIAQRYGTTDTRRSSILLATRSSVIGNDRRKSRDKMYQGNERAYVLLPSMSNLRCRSPHRSCQIITPQGIPSRRAQTAKEARSIMKDIVQNALYTWRAPNKPILGCSPGIEFMTCMDDRTSERLAKANTSGKDAL